MVGWEDREIRQTRDPGPAAPWERPGWVLGFVLGGARSGKTRFALGLGLRWPEPRTYVATAFPGDEEMRARIEHHRRERGPAWRTIEAGANLQVSLVSALASSRFVVVDCLTLWMSRCWMEGMDDRTVLDRLDGVIGVVRAGTTPCVFVSNEVGLGVVPEHPAGRHFRDMAGWAHQKLARAADWAVIMFAGYPVVLKPGHPGVGPVP